MESPSEIQKLFEEAKESPDEWPSLFNADKSNFSHGALRKLSKIPQIAKSMGETFFNSIVNGTPIDESMSESTSVVEMETEMKQPLHIKKFGPSFGSHTNVGNRDRHQVDDENHDGHYLSEINKEALLTRLRSSIERAYTTVTDMTINTEALEVAIEVVGDNTIVPTHKCLICRMVLKIGYGARKGKFKQYFTGNMRKHLIKQHFVKREFTEVPEDASV